MTLFYSAARAGFFDDRIHSTLPVDAVRISATDHARLLADQAAGATIQPDADGRTPCARRAVLSLAVRRDAAIGATRVEARRRILLVASIERQTNDNALVARAALGGTAIGVKVDAAQLSAALARIAQVDALRAASDRIEMTVGTMDDRALAALDVSADAHWPA